MDAGLPGGQRRDQKSEGTRRPVDPSPLPAPTGSPLPPSPRDHCRLSGLGPHGPHTRPGRPGSPPGLWTGAAAGASGVEAEVGPRLPEERGAPHYAGLARDARPLAPAASSRDVAGLQPSALRDLLPATATSPGERRWLQGRGASSGSRKETRGQPPEAWEACLPSRW